MKFSEVWGVTNFKPFSLGNYERKFATKNPPSFHAGGWGKFHHLNLLGAALRNVSESCIGWCQFIRREVLHIKGHLLLGHNCGQWYEDGGLSSKRNLQDPGCSFTSNTDSVSAPDTLKTVTSLNSEKNEGGGGNSGGENIPFADWNVSSVVFQKNSRRLKLSISENTPHGRCRQGPGSVDPRFPAGLPFPVPEIQEFVAFRDPGKFFQQFSRDFPGVFPENPRTDPGNSHSLLEFSECWSLEMPQEPFSRPQPQYWIKILDPWMQYFYPVLGWVWHPYREIHNSSQHPYWIKIDFPYHKSPPQKRFWTPHLWYDFPPPLFTQCHSP